MSQRPRQLALALDHAESYAREDFLVGPCNEDPFQLICSWPDWPANALALVGPEGSGKTHLAMIWAAMAGARIVSARALRDAEVRPRSRPARWWWKILLPTRTTARYFLINLAREDNAALLFTARSAPATWPVAIPDLCRACARCRS